ncbi:MAG TPA: hypothetical protein VHQ01_09050 [Pyrinomonadaceae bacterium]|nr:hypothetical protein [Pyrinomonadaceae bacterium]
MNDITPADLAHGRKLKIGAIIAPVILTVLPAVVTLLLLLLTAPTPPVAAVTLFVGIVATALGFVTGMSVLGLLVHKRSVWTKEMRERIAADGIKAEEIGWFTNELKSNEKRALKAVEARDLLLADAYRETLASRLTATRIVKSSKRELLLAKRRQNSIRQLKSARAEEFQAEIGRDLEKIGKINDEAKLMLSESEARLQMIEAAASRGGNLADSELALKKLSARTAQLPLALESAKMADEIRLELEKEDAENIPELELDN